MNKWKVSLEEEGCRLLTFLKEKLKDQFSTQDVRFALEHNRCFINGKVERFGSRKVRAGELITFSCEKKEVVTLEKSRILFEDDFLIAYDKPAGIDSPTLAQKGGFFLVHRLDRDTTGVLLLTKTFQAKEALEVLFRERKMQKCYLAIVLGPVKQASGNIVNKIGKLKEGLFGVVHNQEGLLAETKWVLEKSGSQFSLIRCFPKTGRTHQIRVHLSHIGHPIAGDVTYSNRNSHPVFQPFRPLLHAQSIAFDHPFEKKPLLIESTVPKDFLEGISHI